jgi:hypothetical protein
MANFAWIFPYFFQVSVYKSNSKLKHISSHIVTKYFLEKASDHAFKYLDCCSLISGTPAIVPLSKALDPLKTALYTGDRRQLLYSIL